MCNGWWSLPFSGKLLAIVPLSALNHVAGMPEWNLVWVDHSQHWAAVPRLWQGWRKQFTAVEAMRQTRARSYSSDRVDRSLRSPPSGACTNNTYVAYLPNSQSRHAMLTLVSSIQDFRVIMECETCDREWFCVGLSRVACRRSLHLRSTPHTPPCFGHTPPITYTTPPLRSIIRYYLMSIE